MGVTKRSYPHVSDIKDGPTQRSLRLLWDKVYDILDGVNTATADTATAQANLDTQQQTLNQVEQRVRQALITSGLTPELISQLTARLPDILALLP